MKGRSRIDQLQISATAREQCCFAWVLRHHRAILGRAVQKGVAGRNLFTGRALERFVRILAAEKLFYFRKCDGVAHDG